MELTEHIADKIRATDAVLLWRVMENSDQDFKNISHVMERI
jgi:hypothetical protein